MKIKTAATQAGKDFAYVIYFLTKEDEPALQNLPLGDFLVRLAQQESKLTEKEKITCGFYEVEGALKKLFIVGMGKAGEVTSQAWRQAAGEAARAAYSTEAQEALVLAPQAVTGTALAALTEGLYLGAYKFTVRKSKKETKTKVNFQIVHNVAEGTKAINAALLVAKNICWARDLINEPGNIIYPEVLGKLSTELAQKLSLKCEVLDKKALEKKNMGGLLAVGKGSKREPRLITLKYQGAGAEQPYLAFVGKGITFDSGGISLKSSANMGDMKDDMSGAAVALGALKSIAELKLSVNVMAIATCAENMPSGSATRPGDVITTASGKTVEIINTDAEGRVALSDAVWYACEQGAARVIDVATLTGACIVALGNDTAGIMSNDDNFCRQVIAAGKQAGECYWQLPCLPEIKKMLKGDTGDVKNETGRAGGAISAGLFIAEFMKKDVPWVHLDIAGPAYVSKAQGHWTQGATGFALATLVEVAKEYGKC